MSRRKIRSAFRCLVFGCLVFGQAVGALGFYNPQTGRWLSRDPAGETADRNVYAAVRNGPVQRVDALGDMTVNFAGNGFQFVNSPHYLLYLAMYARFSAEDAIATGQEAAVISRFYLDWAIGGCCEARRTGRNLTMYFYDGIMFLDSFNGTISGGASANLPYIDDPEYKDVPVVWFNPLNTSAVELMDLAGTPYSGLDLFVLEGEVHLSWEARLIKGGSGSDAGFNINAPSAAEGPAPMGVEAQHKKWTESQPTAWTAPSIASATIDIGFRWSDCRMPKMRQFEWNYGPNVIPRGFTRLENGNPRVPPYPDLTEFYSNSGTPLTFPSR